MIDHLVSIDDLLVKLFTKNELRPIKDVTAYHSPEVSETDDENVDKRKIICYKRFKMAFNNSKLSDWYLIKF